VVSEGRKALKPHESYVPSLHFLLLKCFTSMKPNILHRQRVMKTSEDIEHVWIIGIKISLTNFSL
jgi:hypothetical protein